MNWYKKNIKESWTPGGMEPIMDQYSRGIKPPSAHYKEEFNGRVTANPFLGTNTRDNDHHKGTSRLEPEDDGQNLRHLPGESVLMDQDPPTGEGVNKEQFVDEKDKRPKGDENSRRLDRGLPPIKKNIYKKLRNRSSVSPINRI